MTIYLNQKRKFSYRVIEVCVVPQKFNLSSIIYHDV